MQVTRLRAATYQSSLDEEKLHMKAEQLMIPSEQRPMPGWTKMHAPPLGVILAWCWQEYRLEQQGFQTQLAL